MKKNIKIKIINISLFTVISSSMMLTACNSGSNVNSTSANSDNSSLAQWKDSLQYVDPKASSSSLAASGTTQQQAITVPASGLTLSKVRTTLFNSNSCQYGTSLGSVTLDGGSSISLTQGTYYSSNSSNLALYNKFTALGVTPTTASSVRFDYQYDSANGGPGWVSADCMQNTGLANYDSGTGVACTTGQSCGFAVAQTATLPNTYLRVIFVTSRTTNGNMQATANALPTSPNVTSGINGANYICNYDTNKPSRSAGANFKALLIPQDATISSKAYYRTDYTTNIISSAYNFLGATLDTSTATYSTTAGTFSNLTNSIDGTTTSYLFVGGRTGASTIRTCQSGSTTNSTSLPVSWQSSTTTTVVAGKATNTITGTSNSVPQTANTTWNQTINTSSTLSCASMASIMCAQQDD